MAGRRALRGGRRRAGTLSDDRRGATPHQRLSGRFPLACARRARDRRSLWRACEPAGFGLQSRQRDAPRPNQQKREWEAYRPRRRGGGAPHFAGSRTDCKRLLAAQGWRRGVEGVAPDQANERRLQRRPDRARGQLPLFAPHLCLARDHERRASAGCREEPWPQRHAYGRKTLRPPCALVHCRRDPRRGAEVWGRAEQPKRAAAVSADRFRMSDADWARIGPPQGFPEEARGRIDDRIRWFRAFESGMKNRDHPTARSRLESAANATDDLIKALKSLPPEAVDALTLLEATPRGHVSANANPLRMFERMLGRIEELETLKGWLTLGKTRLIAKPSGPTQAIAIGWRANSTEYFMNTRGERLSILRLVNQRIGFLRFAAAVDLHGVWHGWEVSGCGER